jgi:hypothetical protein
MYDAKMFTRKRAEHGVKVLGRVQIY